MELIFRINSNYKGDGAIEDDPKYVGVWDFDTMYSDLDIVKLRSDYYEAITGMSYNQKLPSSYPNVWKQLFEGTIIEEPIGFDNFKTTIERGSEHGISAEVSMDSLEFYGVGFGVVNTAYNTDLDTQLTLWIGIKCRDNNTVFDELYSGLIDLSTYEELKGNYCSCSCKVGEIGQMTTFNNRVETEINLVDGVMKDLDGVDLPTMQLSKEISIPSKALLKKSKNSTSIDKTTTIGVESINLRIFPTLDNIDLSEYVSITPTYDNTASGNEVLYFLTNENYDNAYFKYNLNFKIKNNETTGIYSAISGQLRISTLVGGTYTNIYFGDAFTVDLNETKNINYNGSILLDPNVQVSIYIFIFQDLNHGLDSSIDFTTEKDSEISIDRLDISDPSPSRIVLPIDAFNRLSEINSGLTVKSDWYNNVDGFGGGALKGLINGYQLRGSIAITNVPTLFTTSFKQLFLDLKAIDNIGWGFVYEIGVLYLRIENWKWFYKNETILSITNPEEINRQLDVSKLTSRLKIGYSKYAAIEDINSIDGFHTERNYSNGLKAVDKELSQISKLISDPYAIEFTRRKYFDATTKDWKYDENTFIIALRNNGSYEVDLGVNNSGDSMISPETMFNFRITPKRNAIRFRDSIIQGNLTKEFKLTSGTGNIEAFGIPNEDVGYTYLDVIGGGSIESSPISQGDDPILKPELLTVEYPLSFADFKTIKTNPYGQITVDGEITYLKKIEFSPLEGKAKFVLIPKV